MNAISNFKTVAPTKPAAPYLGGKRNLASRIIERIDAVPHALYAEPFVGMGGVFLRRTQVPKSEVINDWNGDVANFFRILQRHHGQFMDTLRYQLASRCEFDRLKAMDPETLTDLERAARFLYLQKAAFGGLVVGRAFGASPSKSIAFDAAKLSANLDALHKRLVGVVIERLPYREFINRYDHPETLFYLDPPYWGAEGYYGKELFERSDYECLANQLASIDGRFILSLNDTPGVRRVFEQFQIEQAAVAYTAAPRGVKRTSELIITGP